MPTPAQKLQTYIKTQFDDAVGTRAGPHRKDSAPMLPQLRLTLAAAVVLTLASVTHAQEPIRFARTPDISPDGKLIAFSYLGDIWTVEAIGGVARPVTMHEAHDINPVFSPDGKWIAFSSNRHGSYDVFVRKERSASDCSLTLNNGSTPLELARCKKIALADAGAKGAAQRPEESLFLELGEAPGDVQRPMQRCVA